MFKKLLSLILIALLLFPSTAFLPAEALAEEGALEGSSYVQTFQDLQEKIKEYEEKIAELQKEENTLKNQIAYLDSQIYLTNLKIKEAETKIAAAKEELLILKEDISLLEKRILRLGEALSFQEEILGVRVRARYKSEKISALEVIFGADSLFNIVAKIKYLKVMEAQDRELLEQMRTTRQNYKGQKALLEEKKLEVEKIKAEIENQKANLEAYKENLSSQKATKEWLLKETQNKEEHYQLLLAQVRSEIESISWALKNVIGTEGQEIKRGNVVGVEGNTGCSTGPHVHFGVYKDGVAIDPKPYLDSGELLSPEVGYPGNITQWYGENYDWYMRYFGVPGHHGIDMSNGLGSPILAAADGIAYKTQDTSACWLTGTVGRGIVIDHGGGLVTVYWHVQ